MPATLAFGLAYALLLLVAVRLLSLGLREGTHPDAQPDRLAGVDGHAADGPLPRDAVPAVRRADHAGVAAAAGDAVGRGAEVSTVLALPSLTTVGEGAFLADDTLTAPYELGGGWLRIGRAEIGERAFLGNSGMTAPGRAVPDGGWSGCCRRRRRRPRRAARTWACRR